MMLSSIGEATGQYFGKGLSGLNPTKYNFENSCNRYGEKHPCHSPNHSPEHQTNQNRDRVEIHGLAHHFGLNNITYSKLDAANQGKDQKKVKAKLVL